MTDSGGKESGPGSPDSPGTKPLGAQIAPGLHHHVVPTERCGALNVYIQGDIEEARKDKDSKCVFICVHDVGCNHNSIKNFIDSESFEEIRKRAVFIHVDIPGHEDGAEDLPDSFTFPTIQVLGEDLVTVLDQLRVRYVIGIGDGAGANLLARFSMMHVTRCLGVIMLHPTSNKTTMTKAFKDKFSKWKVGKTNANDPTGEHLAVFRKYGHKLEEAEDKEKAIEEYAQQLGKNLNKKNMKKYITAFANRTDITPNLSKNLRCDSLIIVGSKTSHVVAAEHMHAHMDKTKSSLLKIDGVGNVLDEAPTKLANAILLFCKGLGWLTSVNLPGVERRTSMDKPKRQRSVSMEDYDKPNIRRLSISASNANAGRE